MRVLSGLIVTVLPLAVATVPPSASSASAASAVTAVAGTNERAAPRSTVPRCQGRRATRVGDPGRRLTGTPGDDVLVSNGAIAVRGLGGNDLICLTRSAKVRPDRTIAVDAGRGDDRVHVVGAAPRRAEVVLGPGSDMFWGGSGAETVYAHAMFEGGRDDGRDVIRAGAGADTVYAGGEANVDLITLGSGNDRALLSSSAMAPAAHLDGGSGIDVVRLTRALDEIDNRTGRGLGTRNGIEVLRASAFEDFGTVATFLGGPADEVVEATGRADMGAGDDTVRISLRFGAGPESAAPVLDGGAGRDLVLATGIYLGVGLARHASFDLDSGTAVLDEQQVQLSGFEDVAAAAYDELAILGDAGDNTLSGLSCDTRIEGRGGDDRLSSMSNLDIRDEGAFCPGLPSFGHGPAVLLGQDGDDVLRGGRGDDELVGGAGLDIADGREGPDTCEAETVRNCETVG
ncbi:hypothetical protein [Nocardioides sp. R-C-SC26]|uniref:hypothetical protein n=1 Tax=Nocardioides sp. R-C-SC26 TaxID=2870414 RepID=UPI001E46C1CB|nr:hypothetical protein [Nocardioides sp. R-C-SC26]